jgi:large subunit ribosomal protein L25
VAENALEVQIRDTSGKGVARKLRAAGRIPGVCYGRGEASVHVTVDPTALRHLLEGSDAGMNTVIHLSAKGSPIDGKLVLVRELQRDPVLGAFMHADFYAVNVKQVVEVKVPIRLTGKARGIDNGGIVDHALRELELACLPLAIPREITVDVSDLDIGSSLHVRDLVLPEGVELRSDLDLSVVSVVTPKAEEEAAPAEAVAVEGEAPAEGEAAEGAEKAEGDKEEKGDD